MRSRILATALIAALPLAASAEVKLAQADAMLIEHRFTIAAPAEKAWETLVHPERYWPANHTWSGKRESLSIDHVAGGSFPEGMGRDRLPSTGKLEMPNRNAMPRTDYAIGCGIERGWRPSSLSTARSRFPAIIDRG